MTKTKLIAVILSAVLLAGGAFAYWHWTRTPTYSLRQIQKAVETHDVPKFEKHVDVESLSSRLIDDMMSEALKETQSGSEELGTALAAGLVQLMKPRLVEAVREQVVRLVERGNFGSSTPATSESDSEKVSLQTISEQIGADQDSFKGITHIKKQGKIALVALGFRNAKLDADLILELKLRDMGGYWQLAEFANVVQLLQEIKSLEAARLAEANEPIRSRISQTLQVAHAKKTNRSDRWGISKNVDLAISVRNTSSREVTAFSATVRLFDPDGKLVKELNIRDQDLIAPSGTGGGRWSVDVNMFDASANRLYDLPSEKVRIEVAFNRVVFGDGTELKVFESLNEVHQQR
jgi:hypothetical protein